MRAEIIKELNRVPEVLIEKIDSYKCRFMGTVDTYDITLVEKDFKYPKSILHKPYGGSEILPVDDEGNTYLEIQYRFPIREAILELPAGRIDEGETFAECAKRELREETGCVSDKIMEQGIIYAQPEFSDEKLGAFLATSCKQTEEQQLDIDETVNVVKLNYEDAIELVKRNIITDERTIIGIGYSRCIQGLRFENRSQNVDEFCDKIREKIHVDGEKLVEDDIEIDYTEPCEFGLVQDHIVRIPGDRNSRRECLYVRAGNMVLPISKKGKIGLLVRYMPAVEKNLIELPEMMEFSKETSFEDFGEMVTAVGYSNDRVKMYICRDMEETVEYYWLRKEDVLKLIEDRCISDGRVLGIIFKYLLGKLD